MTVKSTFAQTAVALLLLLTLGLAGCASGPIVSDNSPGMTRLRQAKQFRSEGLDDKALYAFEAALSENPRLIEAHMGIGDILRERGDYGQASRSYHQATVLNPNSFEAHYYYGLMQHLLGKVQQAVSIYLRALAINPDSFNANLNLASAYLQTGRAGEALPYAKRATELKPEHQLAWANLAAVHSLMRQYTQAVNAYRHAVELGEMAEPILLGLANAHIQLGHYDRAINVLLSLTRQMPSATAFERLGYASFKMRRYNDALTNFSRALALDPNDTSALNGIGVCKMTMFLRSGRGSLVYRDEALDAWRKSIQLRPNQGKIIALLSRYQRI